MLGHCGVTLLGDSCVFWDVDGGKRKAVFAGCDKHLRCLISEKDYPEGIWRKWKSAIHDCLLAKGLKSARFVLYFKEMKGFKLRNKALDIGSDSPRFGAKLDGDPFNDFGFCVAVSEKFEDSRAYSVRTEHLSVQDVEDDSAIAVMRGSDLRG